MDKCVAFEMIDPKDALEHIQNNIEYITIKKTDLIKICIKMLKIIKNSLQ